MKLSAAASRPPSSQSSRDPPDVGGASDVPPSAINISLDFWRAIFRNNESMAKQHLRRIQEHRGGDIFSFDELAELSAPPTEGKYSPRISLPPGTPRTTVDHWNSPRATTLLRVDPEVHCLSLVGDASKQSDLYFLGCAQLVRGTGGPDECGFGTHADESRPRVLGPSDGAAYVVKTVNASKATKTKVLSKVLLLEADVPPTALASGFADLLTGLEAPAFVWKIILTAYPGLEEATKMCPGRLTVLKGGTSEGGEDTSAEAARVVEEFLLRPATVAHDPKIGSSVPFPKLVGSGLDEFSESADTIQALDQLMASAFAEATQVRDPIRQASSTPRFVLDRDPPESVSEGSLGLQSWPGAHASQSWRPVFNRLQGRFDIFKSNVTKRLDTREATVTSQLRSLYDYTKELFTNLAPRVEALESWRHDEEAGIAGSAKTARQQTGRQANQSCPPLVISPPSPREATVAWEDVSEEQQRTFLNAAADQLGWQNMAPEERSLFTTGIVDQMDLSKLAPLVGRHLRMEALRTSLSHLEGRIAGLEGDLHDPEGSVGALHRKLEEWEARRDSSASSRGGYTFRDQDDVEALVATVPDPEFYRYFLDIFSFLSIAPNSFGTYAEGIKVHADSIKAQFGSVLASKMKLSYEVAYPEVMIKQVDTDATAAQEGTKFTPMFLSSDVFQDQFRKGSHRRILKQVEKIYDLMQLAVDTVFPLSDARGKPGLDARKLNMIISDHNRRGYNQTIGFIESLLPLDRTFRSGGLANSDSWERVHIYAREFMTNIQDVRVSSAEMNTPASMIWGSFKATDLAEEYKKQKFIEHPKVCSILALTSIEREGNSIAEAIASLQSNSDTIGALLKRVVQCEKDLKWVKKKVE